MAMRRPRATRASQRNLIALALYTLLAALLTWPLITRITTHVPGDGIDDPALAWNLWWIKARLIDQIALDIFHSGWLFHPVEINLAFYTLTPLNGLLSIALQTASSLIVASNLVLLSSYILGGFGAYLLAFWILAESGFDRRVRFYAAIFAGIVYAFASSKLFYASLGQFNIASSQWIPFCVLYVLRLGESASWRDGLRNASFAALFLTFQAWAELTFASFLLIFIGTFTLWSLYDRFRSSPSVERITARQLILLLLIVGGLFTIGISPFLWAMLPDMWAEGDFFARGGGFAQEFSADLLGYLTPTRLHPFLGDWVRGLPFSNAKGQHIFVGFSALALAILGVVSWLRQPAPRTRRWGWFWLLNALLFWLLTLGPSAQLAGQDLGVTGPFALVSQLPFFSGNRYPSRYSVMLMLCVAILAAYGLAWLMARIARNNVDGADNVGHAISVTSPLDMNRPANCRSYDSSRRQWIFAFALTCASLLFLLEHLATPLPLSDFRFPQIYEQLASAEPNSALLELPTGWRNGARVQGKSDLLIMMQQWVQTQHGLPRLGGNTSRNPPFKFDYFVEAPLLGDLIALMNADRAHIAAVLENDFDTLVARNRPIAADVLKFLGIEHVLVHVEKSPPALLAFIDAALPLSLVDEWQGDWSGAPSTIRLYAVEPPDPQSGFEIDLAGPAGRLHLAEGWSALPAHAGRIRYATRPAAELMLDLPDAGGTLALELVGPAPSVDVALNGHALATANTGSIESPPWIEIEIPPGLADQTIDRLRLDFGDASALAVSQIAPPTNAGWPVGATGATLPPSAAIVARSAGEEVGDYARIYVNGQDVAHDARGYNLIAVDPAGQILDRAIFDTHESPAESAAMAAWLDAWPDGVIIAGAVADEASHNLGQDAVDALARIGVATDLRDKFRWSHAFVGASGAPQGSAVEAAGLLSPVTVAVGAPIDGEFVSGGVGRVLFSPAE